MRTVLNWREGKTSELSETFKTRVIPIKELLSKSSSIIRSSANSTVLYADKDISSQIPLKSIIDPSLLKVFETLSDQGKFSKAKDLIVEMNEDSKKSISLSLIKENDGFKICNLSRINRLSENPINIEDFLIKNLPDITKNFTYWRFAGEKNSVEFQFLSDNIRKEVKPGDFIDPGLFVTMTPRDRKSAIGFNRLVCGNGLIKQLESIETGSNPFSLDKKAEIEKLFEWFKGTTKRPVHSIREIAMALDKNVPSRILNKFWKTWAEKIDLKELTYFDVIADITNVANSTLSNARYNSLKLQDHFEAFDEHKSCPICAATTI